MAIAAPIIAAGVAVIAAVSSPVAASAALLAAPPAPIAIIIHVVVGASPAGAAARLGLRTARLAPAAPLALLPPRPALPVPLAGGRPAGPAGPARLAAVLGSAVAAGPAAILLARRRRLGVLSANLPDAHVELFKESPVDGRLVQVDPGRNRRLRRDGARDLASLPPRRGMHERVLEQQAVLWRARPRPDRAEQGLFGPQELYRARRHHGKPLEAAGPCQDARADGRAQDHGQVRRGRLHLRPKALLDAAPQVVQAGHLAGQPLHRVQVLVGDLAAAAPLGHGREHLHLCVVEPRSLKVLCGKAVPPACQRDRGVPGNAVDQVAKLRKVQAVPLAHARV